MEAIGLTVGLLGLVGTLKDCIDLFSYISASRAIGRDYELLDTKLDVEKTRLLQWADRVRLLHLQHGQTHGNDYTLPSNQTLPDDRLHKTSTIDAVSRVLGCVRLLLSESNDLQHRYGLRPAENDSVGDVIPVLSGPRMAQFLRRLDNLKIHPPDKKKDLPVMKKVRWVIHDKVKFEELVRELSSFISKLNELVPDVRYLVKDMTKDDLRLVQNNKRLQLVSAASSGHRSSMVADLAEQVMTENCQIWILQRIWFRMMNDRRDQLVHPHSKTLHWALKPPGARAEWDDLSTWLQSGSGIYWITGKAGSGKSTLMKYIFSHAKTLMLLETWANGSPLCIGSFFLWNLGAEEQKSQEGLSRALLYNILETIPSLTETLLPNMWREALNCEDGKIRPPSMTEIREAFHKLSNIGHTKAMPQKFIFFIDGLDEYAGNYMDGIAFLRNLAKSPSIKILLSSRPISACVQAFSEQPKLHLQDLTKEDITTYVQDTLESHASTNALSFSQQGEMGTITKDLIEKASGVFLWVVLACRSVLEGFTAFDKVSELRRRIDELPPELEDLFQHMLGKIEPRYQEQAAKLLRICQQTKLLAGGKKLPSLGLALVDDYGMDLSQIPSVRVMSDAEKLAKCKTLEQRLRSRCWGLLEIKRGEGGLLDHDSDECFCQFPGGSHDRLIDSTVEFLHRSVFEFLNTSEAWDLKVLSIHDEAFEPNSVLSCLSLHLSHMSFLGTNEPRQAEEYLRVCFEYAYHADSSSSSTISAVLLKIQEVILEISSDNSSYATVEYDVQSQFLTKLRRLVDRSADDRESHLAFLLAVEAGMTNSVHAYMAVNNIPQSALRGLPLLYRAIARPYLAPLQCQNLPLSTDLIQVLLSSGCDPNEAFVNGYGVTRTPWESWLKSIGSQRSLATLLITEVTEMFIHAGAEISQAEAEKLSKLIKERVYGWSREGGDSIRDKKIITGKANNLLRLIGVKVFEQDSANAAGGNKRKRELEHSLHGSSSKYPRLM